MPLNADFISVMEKYSWELPRISEQKYNYYLKEAAKVAGINTPVEIIDYRGGNKTYSEKPKYELLTSHIAIKTFISHCLERGIPPAQVSHFTGKTIKTIIGHYYGKSDSVAKEMMKKAFG